MCGNQTCPLAWRDRLNLRALCNEIEYELPGSLMSRRIEPGWVIYDVCQKLGVEPRDVLPAEVVNRIEQWKNSRLWPTLTEAEDAEMVELDGIRVPYDQVYIDALKSWRGDGPIPWKSDK